MTPPPWIPDYLLAPGPAGLAWWQWIGLPILAATAALLGRLAGGLVLRALRRVVRRSTITWDDVLVERLSGPMRLFAAIGSVRIGLPLIALPPAATGVVHELLLVGIGLGVLWGTFQVIDIVVANTATAAWALERPASRSLVLLGGRIAKVVVIVIALIAVLAGLGLPVASLIAGLGIGGIALAFGAQKTVENLFGAFAIGVDQPLREGDFVRIEDSVLGTVEQVGLRSTRIRTLDRTIVTLPNGRLADMRIETFALRDRCRLATTLGLVYATTAPQLRTVLDGFEATLRAHTGIWPDDVVVRFVGFGASSLDIEVMAWFQTGDWGQFRTWRQEVLLGFMAVVEAAGSSFAFPTQTIHLQPVTPSRDRSV